MTYFPKALWTWNGSAMAPALQGNPDGLSGPSSQRGFRAGDQDLVCRHLDAPLATFSTLSAPAAVRDWPQESHPVPWTLPCTLSLGTFGLGTLPKPLPPPTAHSRHYYFPGLWTWPNSTLHWGTKLCWWDCFYCFPVFTHGLPPPTKMASLSYLPPQIHQRQSIHLQKHLRDWQRLDLSQHDLYAGGTPLPKACWAPADQAHN